MEKITYNRKAAIDYARKFWNLPCSDRFIGSGRTPFSIKAPLGTKFVHEFDSAGQNARSEHAEVPGGQFVASYEQLDDCTHYISCCIGQPPKEDAGGLPILNQMGQPPKDPYGILRAEKMIEYLTNKKFVSVEGLKITNKDVIKRLEPGDLIGYFSPNAQRHTHLVMYLGDGKIGCHTYCRFDNSAPEWENRWDNNWDIGQGVFKWTFLRFIV